MRVPAIIAILAVAACQGDRPEASARSAGQPVTQAGAFDLVISGGRVMDPETDLDAIRNVGVVDGRIAAVTEDVLEGAESIDASGLVVAPGFIDLHAHGQDPVSARLQAADGVTTALEMEIGVFPVAEWIATREGQAIINFGATVSHPGARVMVVDGIRTMHWPTLTEEESARLDAGMGVYAELDEDRIAEVIELLERGLTEGGLGIGFGITYTPGASRLEILRTFEMAAARGVPAYVHLRGRDSGGTLGAFQEVIADAAITGASLHIVHMNSSSGDLAPITLGMMRGAREQGLDITTEAYPYTAGSTRLESAAYDGWEDNPNADYGRLQWAATGERLTAETFRQYRATGGWVIAHGRTEEMNEWVTVQPDVMVASDGIPFLYGPAHPRGAGTYARVLGRYVRERGALSLMDALSKMTIQPARRVEDTAPVMARKGRVQVGADADLTLFDPETVIDRSTYADGDEPSAGIIHVIVEGRFVVRDGEVVDGVFPGKAIRGTR
ncbi:MAG: amidohydrolase family protein [Gemmatimonadetes bacterium]|nr:amidohydrolase family protein [Gemmatimonadota bacterium]MYE15286.1 amidohydrolase family protein [Gemmatimonadota bacterium]MYG22318.1 amidohydrolase family protein [Gemmatimonadota bacterium]MYJ38644.1 amidohydrolase family protein [Gemmatimonadota bacterium]